MIPSILAKQLEKGISDYIESSFPMSNEPFIGSLTDMVYQKDNVYHEPYISVQLPFRVSDSKLDFFEGVKPEYTPYVHQEKAFSRLTGDDGRSTIIATGTGSGKTECFLYPILEYCYQHRGEPGIKALIIYPMNALASDQQRRLAELIYNNPNLRGNVTAGMYVGGLERGASTMMSEHGIITDRDTMLNQPPDILLTNYKMLDYLLIRPKDAGLWEENEPETLKYIAVDEMHTFDGAQGTDLACLIRRLKSRMYIPNGHLCCIGTSATIGAKENSDKIISFASEVFGEDFDDDSIITEERLSPAEFFDGCDISEFRLPDNDDLGKLAALIEEDNCDRYITECAKIWFEQFEDDVLTDKGRLILKDKLMHHSFVQSTITMMKNNYWQSSKLADRLIDNYPELKSITDKESLMDSLFALISFARTGSEGKLRTFLNVRVHLWLKELRRTLGKVDLEKVDYALAYDLNQQQKKRYLPVVNCRDCGHTGWVSILNEKRNATIINLPAFYNQYFKADDKVLMMFPNSKDEAPKNAINAFLCPNDLYVTVSDNDEGVCSECGSKAIPVVIPKNVTFGAEGHKSYSCPFCGSKRGLALIGARSATEISVSLSQTFASRFNDDKKTMAFSDSVQDAAHRAGFFNARTWRFGIRLMIQHFAEENEDDLSLKDFQDQFIKYFHEKMSNEDFVSFFIPHNMVWRDAYEKLIQNRKLANDNSARLLIEDIEKRVKYEVLLEYGIRNKLGRTLKTTGSSLLYFKNDDVVAVSESAADRIRNELGDIATFEKQDCAHAVLGVLDRMVSSGAFIDPVFFQFLNSGGQGYLLSASRIGWLPNTPAGRDEPRFVIKYKNSAKIKDSSFTYIDSDYFINHIAKCFSKENVLLHDTCVQVASIIFDELCKNGVLKLNKTDSSFEYYGINKERAMITTDVQALKCNKCGTTTYICKNALELWRNIPCLVEKNGGSLEEYYFPSDNYYGRLYRKGDVARINAKEHTGLLERSDRESLEDEFKEDKDNHMMWDTNVLSCTPTLEMGIDIGDLSSVILCSVPPSQSQYQQRTGRAGRKDGNALTLAIANTRPHDLYFYADPLDMIAGDITPPKVFLKASAVLERQFTAFCMDSWVKTKIDESSIPKQVGTILTKINQRPEDLFPFNFLIYVQRNLNKLINSFIRMFDQDIDEITKAELNNFAKGDKGAGGKSPMHLRLLESFENLKKQRDSIQTSVNRLKEIIKELEAKPKDSSYEKEIKEVKKQEAALIEVINAINKKDVFNHLTDEGLLPNYAFPEAGITLRVVLTKKEEEEDTTAKSKYKRITYEYQRSASSAISEFAPNNYFYADGRKLKIDQVDLSTSSISKWRLCPNCSHAEVEDPTKNVASCPQCGSPIWADSGQIRNMLKVNSVFSNSDYKNSLIGDDSEDRSVTFYSKQLLVDVDEEKDIQSAYSMNNDDFPFGYEFVRKAVLREINYGESDTVGEKLTVAGEEDIRNGFLICKHCGKIQEKGSKPEHAYWCKAKKNENELLSETNYEECLFLYREFETEILRLLIPSTTMDSTLVRTESFVAAFMLGMKEYFGNVDHLRATVSEVPIPEVGYRKRYLVIYDSVPGGTGYLKQLMQEKNVLVKVFEKALDVLENCTCKEDPKKDGCYHCLYAYRQSNNIGEISRTVAIDILKSILSGKDNIEKIDKIGKIPVNTLFESELERKFIEAFDYKERSNQQIDISKSLVNEKQGYILTVNGLTWQIEPQVTVGPTDNVCVTSKPDFVIWPITAPNHKPVAIFTDGFAYHKDISADDTLKRNAIVQSNNYRVWSLSYKDVQSVFDNQGDYYTETLDFLSMPTGGVMYKNTVVAKDSASISPEKMSSFDLLMFYLGDEEAEKVFRGQSTAYSWSLIDPRKAIFAEIWDPVYTIANNQIHKAEIGADINSIRGIWSPGTSSLLSAFAALTDRNKDEICVYMCLDDNDTSTEEFEHDWNGLLRFMNVMQFSSCFAAVTKKGLNDNVYTVLATQNSASDIISTSYADTEWSSIYQLLFDESVIAFAKQLEQVKISPPDEVGYELEQDGLGVVAEIEMAWIDKKIACLTENQLEYKGYLEENGWIVIDPKEETSINVFGGNE